MPIVPAIIKEDGAKQRTDVALTASIAGALRERVLAGKVVTANKRKDLALTVTEEGRETALLLSTNTVAGWVKRDNVIPGLNRTLRDYLEEARAEFRANARAAIQEQIIENAEKGLDALVRMPTKAGKKTLTRFKYSRNRKAFFITSKMEEEYDGHDAKLLEVKAKSLMFGLERLDPNRYSTKVDVKNTHLIFNLGALRRVKERRDELLPA